MKKKCKAGQNCKTCAAQKSSENITDKMRKDKNGEDIFYGDILNDCGEKVVIQWKGAGFSWESNLDLACYSNQFEIIGNIYENPELLK